ncbi:hypothetical protein [Acetobacter indonesiensis]|uniref:hypothetical protein n=1 Tax=Acetobacter indonesiensis TaxID=104101 RepID=UPI001F415EBC|nr:hypothetical protein [Acetobacter indonesiensis]
MAGWVYAIGGPHARGEWGFGRTLSVLMRQAHGGVWMVWRYGPQNREWVVRHIRS